MTISQPHQSISSFYVSLHYSSVSIFTTKLDEKIATTSLPTPSLAHTHPPPGSVNPYPWRHINSRSNLRPGGPHCRHSRPGSEKQGGISARLGAASLGALYIFKVLAGMDQVGELVPTSPRKPRQASHSFPHLLIHQRPGSGALQFRGAQRSCFRHSMGPFATRIRQPHGQRIRIHRLGGGQKSRR